MALTEEEFDYIHDNPFYQGLSKLAKQLKAAKVPSNVFSSVAVEHGYDYGKYNKFLGLFKPSSVSPTSGQILFQFEAFPFGEKGFSFLDQKQVQTKAGILEDKKTESPVSQYNAIHMSFADEVRCLYQAKIRHVDEINKLVVRAQEEGSVDPGEFFDCVGDVQTMEMLGKSYAERHKVDDWSIKKKQTPKEKMTDSFRRHCAFYLVKGAKELSSLHDRMKSELALSFAKKDFQSPLSLEEIELEDPEGSNRKAADYVLTFNNLAPKKPEDYFESFSFEQVGLKGYIRTPLRLCRFLYLHQFS